MTTIELSIDTTNFESELAYCVEQEFPVEVTEALLALAKLPRPYNHQSLLDNALEAWNEWGESDNDDFIKAVDRLTGYEPVVCEDCSDIMWEDFTTEVNGTDRVCDRVCLESYYYCNGCEGHQNDYTTTVGDQEYCDSCLRNYCTFCDDCDEYFHDDDDHTHASDCDCQAPHLRFEFPANGEGTVKQDERLTIELPKGTIDEEGLRLITKKVREAIYPNDNAWQVNGIISDIGPEWQAKRGNFTRRLSSALHKIGVKLEPHVISEVGNLARAHSSNSATWYVEFTRDLNQSSEYFHNGDSCWWGCYAESRCCLKNWGGLAIRTFESEGTCIDDPSGRAWIQPLDADLKPTHDIMNAHAYVVFNGYGELDGYTPARIVAHLTGRTYKKIEFNPDDMYVNGNHGYLIADEATCADTEDVCISGDPHSQYDAHNLNRSTA